MRVESCVESQIFQDLGRIDPDYLDNQYEEVSKLIRSYLHWGIFFVVVVCSIFVSPNSSYRTIARSGR